MEKYVKIVVFVPETHAEVVRQAMGNAGAGIIGNYSHCFSSVKVKSVFKPMEGAIPTIGKVGKLEEVAEERIETVCLKEKLDIVLAAVKKVHPYEETAIDIYDVRLG